jgi:hypothetical protein
MCNSVDELFAGRLKEDLEAAVGRLARQHWQQRRQPLGGVDYTRAARQHTSRIG